jgi:cyclin H
LPASIPKCTSLPNIHRLNNFFPNFEHDKTQFGNLHAYIPTMIEDEVYRTSSQYRNWSYTREALASLRQSTNDLASERVRIAIRRARHAKSLQDDFENGVGKTNGGDLDNSTIDTLTVEEELKIVSWFSSKIIEIGGAMEPPIPMEIRVLQP